MVNNLNETKKRRELYYTWAKHSIAPTRRITARNSAVAVIADRTACKLQRTCTVYWQTIKPVSVTSWHTAGTHDPIQRVEFMNAPKLYPLKSD